MGYDTLYASTYAGLPATGLSCGMCHSATKAAWEKTNHATMANRAFTGQLETAIMAGGVQKGAYASGCIKCHTTGWEPSANNGNFGYLAKQSGFDTTWYAGLELASGDYWIPTGDQSIWNKMTAQEQATATIGCEQCHGPGAGHMQNGGNKTMISRSFEAGSCTQCHEASAKHHVGMDWRASTHSNMATSAAEANRSACWPCHSGAAMADYVKNMTTPDYTKTEVVASIACATCHDPHDNTNPKQLRTVTQKPLNNGYVTPPEVGGMGNLCMNCHRNRVDSKARVTTQLNVWTARYYPHYAPQADMYFGANAYEYNLPITGLMTHAGAKDGCVTCHMWERNALANHQMTMVDPTTGKDAVEACKECHGPDVEEFTDVKGAADYDGNGTVEGAITEIKGMLAILKGMLPKNPAGNVIGEVAADSVYLAGYNKAQVTPAIWNYYFVLNDKSFGVHNTKYAVALLQASIGMITGVKPVDNNVPSAFMLSQNYPNPFNPSTSISFSMPRATDVHFAVYNMAGQLVRRLATGPVTAGNYTVTWDGRDDNGNIAGTGMYLYRLVATSNGGAVFSATKKMVLVK
jgi:predicted CXXCH cytochrome family protein